MPKYYGSGGWNRSGWNSGRNYNSSQNSSQNPSYSRQNDTQYTQYARQRTAEIRQSQPSMRGPDQVRQAANDWRQTPSEYRSQKQYQIYTDGSCIGNPGGGGWGAIIRSNDKSERIIQGNEQQSTNNRMELEACVQGLRSVEPHSHVELSTDSEYVQKGISGWINKWKSNGWKTYSGGDVLNRDLWESLDEARSSRDVTFKHVRGHNGDEYNEKVDRIANEQAKLARRK